MARPKGTKYIETPEKLWELFEAYKKETDSNPILVHDFVGKDGSSVHREKQRPYSMAGFEVYCFKKGLTVEHYFRNTNDSYTDYCGICSYIKMEIRQNQIEGGMCGIYNASITQRLNGLTDKQEVSTPDKVTELTVNVVSAKKD